MSKLRKRIFAFRCAGVGIYRFFRDETHPKIHLFATVCVIAAGAYFRVSPTEWSLLLLCIGGVLQAEAVNSAV
ncbi:MAG: diacylglycerol kinase family protein [Muribaculaceae bacterium]|nr:diacylglycerol kinase family protein [Muribaculaceae bacterium]